jgi:hypothetical protein
MALGEGRQSVAGGLMMVAVAALLAACTAKAEPQPSPEPSATTTSPSASQEPTDLERPTIEKPTQPDAMRRDDVAGAEAAAQYFLQLYPYVYATGELSEWQAMSHPECIFCQSVDEDVTELFHSGGYATGGQPQIFHMKSREPLPGNSFFRIDIQAAQEPMIEFRTDGPSTTSPGGENLLIFALSREQGRWTIREVQVEDPSFDG